MFKLPEMITTSPPSNDNYKFYEDIITVDNEKNEDLMKSYQVVESSDVNENEDHSDITDIGKQNKEGIEKRIKSDTLVDTHAGDKLNSSEEDEVDTTKSLYSVIGNNANLGSANNQEEFDQHNRGTKTDKNKPEDVNLESFAISEDINATSQRETPSKENKEIGIDYSDDFKTLGITSNNTNVVPGSSTEQQLLDRLLDEEMNPDLQVQPIIASTIRTLASENLSNVSKTSTNLGERTIYFKTNSSSAPINNKPGNDYSLNIPTGNGPETGEIKETVENRLKGIKGLGNFSILFKTNQTAGNGLENLANRNSANLVAISNPTSPLANPTIYIPLTNKVTTTPTTSKDTGSVDYKLGREDETYVSKQNGKQIWWQ